MKYIILCLIQICTVILLTSCTTTMGRPFNLSSVEIIAGKSTIHDVKNSLGEPYKTNVSLYNGSERTVNTYMETSIFLGPYGLRAVTGSRLLQLELKDDVINAFLYNSYYQEDSTDFNLDLKDKIVLNSSDKQEISNIMGKPSGILILPSKLFDDGLYSLYKTQVPQGTSEVWAYLYIMNNTGKKYIKMLVIYFTNDGIVDSIDYYTEGTLPGETGHTVSSEAQDKAEP